MRTLYGNPGPPKTIPRNGAGKLGCCCLFATVLGFQPQSCYFYYGPNEYVTWPAVDIDNSYPLLSTGPSAWSFSAENAGVIFGDLYTDAGCTIFDATIGPNFVVTFTVTLAGVTYSVTGTNGGTTVFYGTGIKGAAIANTVPGATGTVTIT